MPDSHGEVRTPEVISHALKNLDDAALVRVLGNLMSSHPQVAPRIVSMALPELTFLPTKALVAKRSLGVIVQVGNEGGMIECPELEAAFGSAVLVGRNQLGPYTLGQEVSFAVTINEDNKPQAFDLQVMPGLGAAATSLAAGVLPLPLLPLPGLLGGLPGLPGALPGATLPPSLPTGLPAGLPGTLPGALPGATLPGLPAALSAALPGGLPLPLPGLLPGLAAGTLPAEPPQPAPVVKTPPAPVQTPTQSPNGDQILGTFLGVVRTVDEDKGFGFITSDQLRGQGINEDCYVHKHYLGRDFNVGSEVSFTAFLDARNGRPRAKDLKDAKGKVGPQSTMMPPAAPTLPGAGLGLPGLGLPLPGLGAGLTAPPTAPPGGMPCGGEKEDSIGTYKGTVKSYNAAKGFGFIVCPELQKEGWSDDIYLQRKNTNDMPFKSGDYVSFEAFIFQGRLQGRNPVRLDGPGPGSELENMWMEGSWEDAGSGSGWTKGDAIAKGKFKGAKGKGKGPMGINPMAMNMMMAMMGMGGKG